MSKMKAVPSTGKTHFFVSFEIPTEQFWAVRLSWAELSIPTDSTQLNQLSLVESVAIYEQGLKSAILQV